MRLFKTIFCLLQCLDNRFFTFYLSHCSHKQTSEEVKNCFFFFLPLLTFLNVIEKKNCKERKKTMLKMHHTILKKQKFFIKQFLPIQGIPKVPLKSEFMLTFVCQNKTTNSMSYDSHDRAVFINTKNCPR